MELGREGKDGKIRNRDGSQVCGRWPAGPDGFDFEYLVPIYTVIP